ncbi:MAG: hypothetical protein HUU01_16670 [Saprospiraceae bacterium]|nr:hypothetical protein [Saprospiraceae bacterium]
MNVPVTPKERLLMALLEYKIAVVTIESNHLVLEKGYEVEIEQNGIFKLKSDGYVVAPFPDPEALCRFITYDA